MLDIDHQVHADSFTDNVSYPFGTNTVTNFPCKSSKGKQQLVRKDTKQKKHERQDNKKEKEEKEKEKEKANNNNNDNNNNNTNDNNNDDNNNNNPGSTYSPFGNSLEIPLDDFTLSTNFQTMPPSLSWK